jgi:hypothetical protein
MFFPVEVETITEELVVKVEGLCGISTRKEEEEEDCIVWRKRRKKNGKKREMKYSLATFF